MDNAELNILNELELEENEDLRDVNQRYNSFQYKKFYTNIAQNEIILQILHINIRSAQKNFDMFLAFIETFQIKDLDIIIFGETRNILNVNNFSIPGFKTYYNNSKNNQNDGVLIFIKDHISTKINHDILPLTNTTITDISFKLSNIEFTVMTCYRSPNANDILFLTDLEPYLKNHKGNNIDIFIGDINFDILNTRETHSNRYLSMMSYLGFKSYINSYTRVTQDSSTCLDHIFIRRNKETKNLIPNAIVIETDVTDHFPVYLNISLDNTKHSNTTENKTITKFDEEKFENIIRSMHWDNIVALNDPEIANNKFVDIFTSIYKECTITKTIQLKKFKKIKPWITNGIICSIKHRDSLKKRVINNKHNTNLLLEYRTYRNILNRTIKNAKNRFYANLINTNANNIRKIYKIISDAANENNNKTDKGINVLDNNNLEFSNDTDMANFCNKYYVNMGVDMASVIKEPPAPINIKYPNINKSMALKPVSENEIIMQINSLKNNSTPGFDGISSRFIKKYHKYILIPLVHIINLIFSTGIVPSLFKISVVTPIFKKGSKTDIINYRPISVITTFAKIFEKCLKDRLYDYLTLHNILNENQFGFIKTISTNDAIFHLTDNIKKCLDNNEKTIAVFLDLAKAFDTVPHIQLVNTLEYYGVRGVVLNVFRDYLRDRKQKVKIRNTTSDPLVVKIGIPQGTVLGPLLFIVYINSLLSLNINGISISYADDTVLLFKGKTWDETRSKVIKGLDIIKNWLNQNKLTLNSEKTLYIAFSLTNAIRPNFSSITLNNHKITVKEADTTKYLGITIDKNLKWTCHIQNLTNKIRRLIHKFYLIRKILNKKLLIQIYKSLVESIIRYGIVVWGGLCDNALRQLCITQNYILRVIFFKDRLYSTNLLYSDDILNIREIYYLSNCIFCFKLQNKKDLVNHRYQTRSNVNKMMMVPFKKYNANQRFTTVLAPKIYNILPLEIRAINNYKCYVNKCKNFIHQNSEYIKRLL